MITCVYKYGLCLHDLSNSFNGPYPPDEVEMWRNKAKVFEEEYKFPYSEKLFSRPIMVITMPVQIRIDMAIVRYKHKLRGDIKLFSGKKPNRDCQIQCKAKQAMQYIAILDTLFS